MKGWNYRRLRTYTDGVKHYRLIEVFYGEDGSIMGWSEADAPCGSTTREIARDIRNMEGALMKPVLELKDLPQ